MERVEFDEDDASEKSRYSRGRDNLLTGDGLTDREGIVDSNSGGEGDRAGSLRGALVGLGFAMLAL